MKRRELKDLIDRARASCQLLLGDGHLAAVLRQVSIELAAAPSPLRHYQIDAAEKEDAVSMLVRDRSPLSAAEVEQMLLRRFAEHTPDSFELDHAKRLAAAPALLRKYLAMLSAEAQPAGMLPRLIAPPEDGTGIIDRLATPEDATAAAAPFDRFAAGKVLRGDLEPVRLSAVRGADEFYGFHYVRLIFKEHFSTFAAGGNVPPLFIVSLPGLGKTAMTAAGTLAHRELTLILPGPHQLENGLRQLLDTLAARRDRRFVLFFDDIDPRQVDWYEFRTNIGGCFAPPDNVACVLAANYDFPPNVLSRGRLLSFPIFDELSCQDMVNDFLIQHKLRNPAANLISVIAADYVEEFGQKKFAELSPRSLIRYLQVYINSADKRKKMLEASHQEMIMRPDAQLFYEQNIKLMRSLYGDGYIEELLKEKLRKLGGR
ncbi:MAG: hypothetical protein PHI85_07910 [Victivallaceae bacterium]|nr:hypothetical protein [Victivallaceae bacterium]